MYYLYKKSKTVDLPKFDYVFKKFKEFYTIASVLTIKFDGNYCIRIITDDYEEIIKFISSNVHSNMVVYIEVSSVILSYIKLHKPGVNTIADKSSYEIFKELIEKHNLLFDRHCISLLYSAIGHSYAEMSEALLMLVNEYGNKKTITKEMLSELFVIDDIIYPRVVLLKYLRMERWRQTSLKKCVDTLGNDLVLYAMRKNVRKLLEEKIKYLKTGKGSDLIKTIPTNNLIHMVWCLDYNRNKFMDITTILYLYEKGETVNDYLQRETISYTNA